MSAAALLAIDHWCSVCLSIRDVRVITTGSVDKYVGVLFVLVRSLSLSSFIHLFVTYLFIYVIFIYSLPHAYSATSIRTTPLITMSYYELFYNQLFNNRLHPSIEVDSRLLMINRLLRDFF
jgi:hypothetical protein